LSGEKLSTPADSENILAELVKAIANTLEVDRCFLYVETMVIQMTPLVQQYVQKNISGVGK
jgi:hypothetical protein